MWHGEGQTEVRLSQGQCVFVSYLFLGEGKGQKERGKRLSVCIKFLRALQCPHDKRRSEQF